MEFLKADSPIRFVCDEGLSRAAILGRLRAGYPVKAVVASYKPAAGCLPASSVPLADSYESMQDALLAGTGPVGAHGHKERYVFLYPNKQ